MRYVRCVVDPSLDGSPLWQVLEEQLHATRAAIRRAKAQHRGLLVNEGAAYSTMRVCAGQEVAMAISSADAKGQSVQPQPGPLAVVYEDDHLLVVDKPAGIPVHPCPGHRDQTLGNFVLHHLRTRGIDDAQLYPVHRLDLGTSGLVVFATNGHAFARLQSFRDEGTGVFERTYRALCQGVLPDQTGIIDEPIARMAPDLPRRIVAPHGKQAITHYQVLATAKEAFSLVELRLETGRTHQIRVHMAHIGHPLVGDALYGGEALGILERPALHAWRLRLTHPITEEPLIVEAPLPADMAGAIAALDWYTT